MNILTSNKWTNLTNSNRDTRLAIVRSGEILHPFLIEKNITTYWIFICQVRERFLKMECLGAPYAFLIYFFAYLSKKKRKKNGFWKCKKHFHFGPC
jgi:hypothetical protein